MAEEKRLARAAEDDGSRISGTRRPTPQSLLCSWRIRQTSEALAKMDELGLTQIPVLEKGRPVVSLRENRVLSKVVRNRHLWIHR